MKIEISKYNKRSFAAVSVSHGDEPELSFDAGGYRTTRTAAAVVVDDESQRPDLFKEANEFVARLPQAKQDALYECYARLENVFQDYAFEPTAQHTGETLEKLLQDEVKNIYDIILFDDLRDYVVGNTALKLPAELSDEYVTTDKITPLYIDRTYRLSEYIDLVAVGLGMRFMIPLWGPYLPIAFEQKGRHMKEYEAFRLLQGSKIFSCRAFDRLDVYVRANLEDAENDITPLFEFLSSEEVPTYLIALAVIRKLSIAPLSAEEEHQHLMKIIYNYAMNRNNQLATQLELNVSAKKGPGEVNADDNSSVWCIYKMKERISAGDLEILQLYISNFRRAADAIEPDIDMAKVALCVEQTLDLNVFQPRETQKALCAWVLSTVVAGVAIDMFDRHHLLISMGVAQAVLWSWGFTELAILLTANPIELDENEFRSTEVRNAISTEVMETLDSIYPYKLSENRYVPAGDSTNAGVRGVECIAVDFNKNEWKPNCSIDLAQTHKRVHVTRRLDPSRDIRDQLSRLLIRLDSHIR